MWYESWNNGKAKLLETNPAGTAPDSSDEVFSGFAAPTWAGLGDFNGDGRKDLAWYEANNNGTLKVFLADEDGFGVVHNWFSGYSAPTKALVGDFTGDGKDDLGWYESWNGTLKVIKANSNGNGTSSGTYDWLIGWGAPDWVDAGDLDGDGKDDLGWYENWNNGKMNVYVSNGNAPGAPVQWFSGYSAPSLAFVADFNGDKREDIAWYESWNNGGTMNVIRTNTAGNGGSAIHQWFSGYSMPDFAAAG